jgi:hypothetical protein
MSNTMTVKEKPILFRGETVNAILGGRKTQTRRVVKGEWVYDGETGVGASWEPPWCPYGVEGDRLWVRESWQAWHKTSHEYDEWEPITRQWLNDRGLKNVNAARNEGYVDSIQYRATSDNCGPWRPSIFLPRWASRITLEITDVRVERLNDISHEDAIAEGCQGYGWVSSSPYIEGPHTDEGELPQEEFQALWESINGAGSWTENPFVWVISFKRVKQ